MSNGSIHLGGHLSKYSKNAPWYLISSIATKLMGFVLLPIYTKYFTQEEIGTLSTYESLGRMLVFVMSLYLDAAFIRFYYKVKAEEQENIPLFFSSHFWFVLVWGGVAAVALAFSVPKVVPGLPPASGHLVPVLAFNQLLAQLVLMLTSIWGANLVARRIAIFQVTFSILSLILTLYLIAFAKQGWESRIYALFVVGIIQAISVLCFVIYSRWLVFKVDWSYIKRSLKYSIPLIPNVAAGWIAMFSDRLIMSYYGQLDQVGIYSISAQLAMALYIINDSITRIQGPLAMSGLTDDPHTAKAEMSKFVLIYFSLIVLFYIGISAVLSPIISIAFGEEYYAATFIFMILGWVYILSGLYRVFTNIISFHGATWVISFGAIFQALVNVAFNLALIPVYGMYAAALSTVISMLCYTLWIFLWSQKLDYVELKYQNMLVIFLTSLAGIFIIYFIDSLREDVVISLLGKMLVVVLVMVVVYLSQEARVKTFLAKKLRRC